MTAENDAGNTVDSSASGPDKIELSLSKKSNQGQGSAKPQRVIDDPKTEGRALRRMLDEEIEGELEAALSGFEGASLLSTPKQERPPKQEVKTDSRGKPARQPEERRTFKVLSVQPDYIYLLVDEKSEGIVPTAQFIEGPPKVGDLVEVVLDRYDAGQDVSLFRRPGASREAEWGAIERGMIVDASVKGANKGGLEVSINGIRGFLPAGQVDVVHVPNLSSLVGQTLRCRVTEIDRSAKNLIVSRRIILEEERAERAKQTLQTLEPGQILEGVVKKVMDFGVFVDIGGLDGLVHVTQMSWTKVNHPGDILSPGQHVKVVVLTVDKETKKIGLGLRQLTDSPWKKIPTTYPPGTICQAKITRLADFGAFAELESGVEGLIHISELSNRRVSRASTVVKEGEIVTVKVMEVDPERQRLGLSIKAVAAAAEAEAKAAYDQAQAEAQAKEEGTVEPTAPKKSTKPLKGGLGGNSGPLFG